MSDVVLTVGADASDFWATMHRTEQQTAGVGRRLDGSLATAGRRIDGMTEGARKFVGALSSTLGIATGLLGAVGLVSGFVAAGVVAYREWASASERAAQAAKEEADARKAALDKVEAMLARDRLSIRGGSEASIDAIRQRTEELRGALDAELDINKAIEERNRLTKELDNDPERVRRRQAYRRRQGLAANAPEDQLLAQYDDLNKAIERYSNNLAEIKKSEQERLQLLREQNVRAVEVEERRMVLELLQAEGDARGALAFQEQINHAERMRRLDELDAQGAQGVENLRRLAEQLHRENLARIDEEARKRAEADAEQREQERERASLSARSVEADILALEGREEEARRLRIRLDLERQILDVKRDQTLTEGERLRLLDLLRRRAELQLAGSPEERSGIARDPTYRTLQGGFIGARQLAGRALGIESPEQRAARAAERQRERALDRLTEILQEVEDIRRRGIPAVLN